MHTSARILQIIDASGWLAVYDVGSGEVRQLLTRSLVCWALLEEPLEDSAAGTKRTRVVGLDAEEVGRLQGPPAVATAGDGAGTGGKVRTPVFLGYAREGENLARFR